MSNIVIVILVVLFLAPQQKPQSKPVPKRAKTIQYEIYQIESSKRFEIGDTVYVARRDSLKAELDSLRIKK